MADPQAASRLLLDAATAADLMSPGPTAVRTDALLSEVVAMMAAKGFQAAPVVDEAGRAVGVVSRSDVLIHDAETPASGDRPPTKVGDVMTPAVLTVTPDAPAAQVVQEMVRYNVHQLYVVGAGDKLVGVVTTHDILRRLHP